MFYIKVVNGQPVDHPIYADNLFAAFPQFETSGVSSDYVVFQRNPRPKGKVYKIIEQTYGWKDGIVQDIWTYRDMTTDELNARPCMYINTETNEYAIREETIRDLHPEIPDGLTGANFPAPSKYEKIIEVDPPETDGTLTQYAKHIPPVKINGVWIQQWELVIRTPEQVEAIKKRFPDLYSN